MLVARLRFRPYPKSRLADSRERGHEFAQINTVPDDAVIHSGQESDTEVAANVVDFRLQPVDRATELLDFVFQFLVLVAKF